MPTYSSHCSVCSKDHDYIRRVNDRNDVPICCDIPTTRTLDAPQVSAMVWTEHKSFHMPDGKNGRGTFISNAQEYKKYLSTSGGLPGPEGKQESERLIAAKHQSIAKKRRATVEAVVTKHLN